LEAFLEALTQASRAYRRLRSISHKLLHNEFKDFNIGSFYRNASKPPNPRQKGRELAGFSRFFIWRLVIEGHKKGSKCLQISIARENIEYL